MMMVHVPHTPNLVVSLCSMLYPWSTQCIHVVDENELLKKQLGESQDTLKQMEEGHHCQIKEAMADLEAAREAHRKEVATVQEAVQQQSTVLTVVEVHVWEGKGRG